MKEMTPQDPEAVSQHFDIFTTLFPNPSVRLERAIDFALELAIVNDEEDGKYECQLPSLHHGYNFLLANWNSSERRLARSYRFFREVSGAVERSPLHQRVIVLGGNDIDSIESVQEEVNIDPMSGPLTFKTGILASNKLDFSYLSRLDSGTRAVKNVRSPCLIASARVVLAEIEQFRYDFGQREEVPTATGGRAGVITLGATIDDDPGKYDRQNFAEASRVIVGDEACDAFLARLNDAYCILDFDGPIQDHVSVE